MRRTLFALLLLFAFAPAIGAAATLTISIRQPTDGLQTNSQQVLGDWTTSGDPNSPKPAITVNGTIAAVNTATFTFNAINIPFVQGDNLITASMTAGPDSASASLHIFFDSVAPTLDVTSPSDSAPISTGFRSVELIGTASNDANDPDPNTITVQAINGFSLIPLATTPGAFDQRVQLNPGLNTVIVSATDKVGNTATNTLSITRTVVCQDPNFPSVTPKTYVVDRNDDLPDPDLSDDVCDVRPDLRTDPDPNDPNVPFVPPIGHCTLRAAIQTANHHPGDDQINIGNRTIVLERVGPGEDAAATGDLDITENLRIFGSGRDAAIIDARKLGDRVFDVSPGVQLQLLRLTVEGGRTAKPAAAPVDPNDAERGGCVRSRGQLALNNVAVLDCKADGLGGGISLEDPDPNDVSTMTCTIVARSQSKLDGGGIASDDSALILRNSTLSLDSAGRRGGALSGAGKPLTLTNVTVSHNKSKLAGGGLDLGDGETSTLNNCTFTANSAKIGATFSTTGSGSVTVSNSILGDTSRFACDPTSPVPVVSLGGNLDRGESCHLSQLTDQVNVDPKLNKLATNVGPPTHALRNGSPAIDFAGRETPCEPLDARDVERGDWPPAGPIFPPHPDPQFCDSGAFELSVPSP